MPLDCANLSRVTHMRVGDRLYPINSYEQASTMFLAALGAWDGPQDAVPDPALCDEDGHELGYVSHSGRCWIGRRADSHATCVFTP
ncbi:MAG: hypothetical protein AB7O88_25710 [Reyranellaceae bacterium]